MVYDIIVSGLGPAGCSFLKELSGSGLKVLAIEKEKFPRKKPCAGGLTPKAYKLLSSLFPELEKVVRARSKEIELHYKSRTSLIKSREPLTYLTDRSELDNFLFEELPSEELKIHTGERCISVERLEDGKISVKTDKDSYTCRVLIVSDGANSRVANQLKVERDLGFTYEIDVEGKGENRIVIDFTHFSWGYYWAFPKGNFITTGVGEFKSKENFKRLYQLLKEFNEKHGFKGKKIWKGGFPIPAGKGKNDVYRDRVLFLGDAGGLVDPLTGEGIYYAARSGVLAAKVIKSSFEKGNFKVLRTYKELVDSEMGEEFKWARITGRLFFPLRNLNFFLIERSEKVSAIAAKLMSGDISYRDSFFSFFKAVPGALLKI